MTSKKMTSESHVERLKRTFVEETVHVERQLKELLDLPMEKLGETHVQYNLSRLQYALELANNLQDKVLPVAEKLDKLEHEIKKLRIMLRKVCKKAVEYEDKMEKKVEEQKARLRRVEKLLKKFPFLNYKELLPKQKRVNQETNRFRNVHEMYHRWKEALERELKQP